MVSLIPSYSAMEDFNISYELVRQKTRTHFPKPKLVYLTFDEYAAMIFAANNNEKRALNQKDSFMEYDDTSNVCYAISDNPDADFKSDRLLFFGHENTHGAQARILGELCLPHTRSKLEQTIFHFFLEGNAEAVAISVLRNNGRCVSVVEEEEALKYDNFGSLKDNYACKTDSNLALCLDAVFKDSDKVGKIVEDYELVLGYFFSQRNAHIPFETLMRNPPKTFKELLVEGVYQP